MTDALTRLREMIRRPSVTPETAGVLDLLAGALEPLGFAIHRLRFEGEGSYPVDNLFAIRDRGGRRLLFAGHTDVVPPGDRALWTVDPFGAEEKDGRLYGRGTADMKSGVAAFVAAAARAVATGAAETGTLALAITNDEEADAVNGTVKLMEWTRQRGLGFDFAIVGEPSSVATVGDSIKVGRRGSFSGTITVTGVQGHVAYPDLAKNPLPVLGAVAVALKAEPLDAGTEHFPASNLEMTSIDTGNPTGNVIPAAATIRFNIRYNTRWTPETLGAWIAERIATVDAQGCSIAFAPAGKAAQAFLSPAGDAVALLDAVIAGATGQAPEHATGGGTSDARFIANYCPVVEFGLPGRTMHKADEHIETRHLEQLTDLYTAFIARYFR